MSRREKDNMNRNSYIAIGVIVIVVVAAIAAVAFSGGTKAETINQKGSDTMLELCQNWAEDFHNEKPLINVIVSGGGSAVGIQALITKNTEIADASRQINQTETSQATTNDVNPVEFKVALDGIAIIVHQSNSIHTLTLAQLRGVYNGTYTNWNQLGGPGRTIVTYGRQSTSGTYAYFQEVVLLKKDYRTDMNQMTGNSAIVDAVKGDAGGIGYVGIGYAKSATGINILDLKKNETAPAYSPTNETAVLTFKYSLSRYLYVYTNGAPTGAVKTYIAWILDQGQTVASQIGYYALPQDVLTQMKAKLG
jgi:phosphate transport system substrate-binding protein